MAAQALRAAVGSSLSGVVIVGGSHIRQQRSVVSDAYLTPGATAVRRLRMKVAAAVAIIVTVAGACSGDSDSAADSEAITTTTAQAPTTTTQAPTTTTAAAISKIDESFLVEQVAKSWDSSRPGAVMISVFDPDGGTVHASIGTDFTDTAPTPDDLFRIGSITKMFTAVTVLSLSEEGLVDLDTPVREYVARVDTDDRVTVRDLLQHSSGLPDYVGGVEYLRMLVDDPTRAWAPEEAIALAPTGEPDFEPGSAFAYSNTNYLVLGLLIEEVTGRPYHDVVRERIIHPLSMSDTYLEGY